MVVHQPSQAVVHKIQGIASSTSAQRPADTWGDALKVFGSAIVRARRRIIQQSVQMFERTFEHVGKSVENVFSNVQASIQTRRQIV